MKTHNPISIPEDIVAKCDAPNQFENFDRLFRAVISVPKETIDKEEAKYRKARSQKKRTNHSNSQ